MRKYKRIEKTVSTEIIAGVKCDICGKEITGKYWRLTTHHHDWGNDSVDSYEHSDLCSRECINKALDDYIKHCEVSYTQCFELEQDIFSCKPESEE
jgi:hypothetical protein